jgi:hypothetical protein
VRSLSTIKVQNFGILCIDLPTNVLYGVGAAGDICPDMNPYLQTTCGVRDPFVIHGDAIVSAEYLGLFGTSETLLLSRCVISKASVAAVRGLWSSSKEAFPVDKVREDRLFVRRK